MKKLIAVIMMFGLFFGTVAITKAADIDIHVGKGRIYRSADQFSSWDANQRDRISGAYRDRTVNQFEYDRLNRELGNVEAYHDQAFSKGWISDRERERLDGMETRLNADVDRMTNEH